MNKLIRLIKSPWEVKINLLETLLARIKTAIYYRRIFGSVGRKSIIYRPLLLSNVRFVDIGNRTIIRPNARIETVVLDERTPPKLSIGDNVNIEQNVHIVCSSRITLGSRISIAPNCCVLDTHHPYQDFDDARKVGDRISSAPVQIEDDTWIGFGCIILPGVHIGKHCVIGANSTVTSEIPDYSVAAGSPASIRKKYDPVKKEWLACLTAGNQDLC